MLSFSSTTTSSPPPRRATGHLLQLPRGGGDNLHNWPIVCLLSFLCRLLLRKDHALVGKACEKWRMLCIGEESHAGIFIVLRHGNGCSLQEQE
nr:hypothetical protein Itr_chr03CG04690 [Ipomoea trifida]